MNEKIKFAAIFDMDGTLLKTEEVAVPAFRQTFEQLKQEGAIDLPIPSDDDFTSVFGMTLEDIWNKLLPGQTDEVKSRADKYMLAKELTILKEEDIHLYSGVKETLTELRRRGVSLFIASNGLDEYIKGVCDHFQMTDWFVDLYSAGRFQTESKDDLVKKLLDDFSIENAVMVGDRKSDIQAGKANRLPTIGCAYGFADEGELQGADHVIRDFAEILPIIEKQRNQ